jgi:hypothetical protein
MKNFSFNDIFSEMFNNDDIFGNKFMQFVAPSGGPFDGRHSMKLMYQRKKAFNLPYTKREDPIKQNEGELPKFIYGPGRGLESKHNLEKWENTEEDNEWTTDDEEEGDNEEEDEEEDLLELFIDDNSMPVDDDKYSCRYCEEKGNLLSLDYEELRKHFIDNHKEQFEEYFGSEVSWEEATKEKKKNKKSNKNKNNVQFMNFDNMFGGMGGIPGFGMGGMPGFGMGGMPGGIPGGNSGFGFMPFDMGQMGQMFGMSGTETEQMMKDMEKMFGGMGFPGAGGASKKK